MSEKRQRTARLPPRRGQIKVRIMSKLVKLVAKVASGIGKVLSGKKVMTGETLLPQP